MPGIRRLAVDGLAALAFARWADVSVDPSAKCDPPL